MHENDAEPPPRPPTVLKTKKNRLATSHAVRKTGDSINVSARGTETC